MKNTLTFIAMLLVLISCSKDVTTEDVLTNLTVSAATIPADASSSVKLSVTLPNDSSTDRRSVIYTCTSGTFENGAKTYTAKAAFENGVLVAKAVLKSTTKPETIEVSASPEFDSPIGDFMLGTSIVTLPSVPATIQLSPSALGLASNHLNEVKLTALLRNTDNKFVSQGYTVKFTDEMLNGDPASGGFREQYLTTTDSAKVSAYYSAAIHPIGTQIKIRCILLDNGVETPLQQATILTINQ
jgi:hypothetical protein